MSVPTAGEFYKSFPCKQGKTLELMIEFAKLHCEAQAKMISEQATHNCHIDWVDPYDYSAGLNGMKGDIDREEILEIYPLSNIK